MNFEYSEDFAKKQDAADELKSFREKFYFPQLEGKDVVYFTGNSLGLQPKTVQDYVLNELEDWAGFGVEGHLHARKPWLPYHEQFSPLLAKITGALPEEVVAMNQLTVNLHLLMVSFYRPSGRRNKILCENRPFSSDQYALESQARFHNLNPGETVIEMSPRKGEYCLRTEDILSKIEELGEELALVMFGGVNYFTGQKFNMEKITAAAHKVGAIAGFDLAHAAGNVELRLHDWNVDFACWCSYKYLNSGPGSVAGAFVHKNHHGKNLPMFAGWWGHDKDSRFKMEKGFKPIPTAEAWQLSNAPVLSMAAHKASLDIFEEAGMSRLLKKQKALTAYLEFVLREVAKRKNKNLEIITPAAEDERGCQISVVAHGMGKELFASLISQGVISDWREPNVIRMAPVPLYNSFEDVFRFGKILEHCLSS
jgi:kynureninase